MLPLVSCLVQLIHLMYAAFAFLQRFNVSDDFTKHKIISLTLWLLLNSFT